MRKVGSKILSWLLTVVIVLGLMPMNAYAAETEGHANHKVCVNADAHAGTCTHEEITDWQALPEDTENLPSGNYYVPDGYECNDVTVSFVANADVVICLNGNVLDAYVQLSNNCTVKVCDCSEDQSGEVEEGVGVYITASNVSNTFELYSGQVLEYVNVERSSSNYAIENHNTVINIYGGSIVSTGSNDSAIKYNTGNGTYDINIYGGKIESLNNNGIYISKNYPVDTFAVGHLDIFGGEIVGAGGIELGNTTCELNISGGTIKASDSDGYAIDVYCDSENEKSSLSITGSPEIVNEDGGAIRACSTINIQDTPKITGYVEPYCNPALDEEEQFFPVFTLTGALGDNVKIPVLFIDESGYDHFEIITSGWSTYMKDEQQNVKTNFEDYFVVAVDEEGYIFYLNDTGEVATGKMRDVSQIPAVYEKAAPERSDIVLELGEPEPSSVVVYMDAACTQESTTVKVTRTGGYYGTYYLETVNHDPLPTGTYYLKIKTDAYIDAVKEIRVTEPTWEAIVFEYGNVSQPDEYENAAIYEISNDLYSRGNYEVKVYDSMDAQNVSEEMVGYIQYGYLYLSPATGADWASGSYYVSVVGNGKAESERVLVYVKGVGANGTIKNVPDSITYGDAPFEIQAVAPEGMEGAEWTWSSSDSSLVTVTPDENDSSKAIVTVLGTTAGVTITATYTTDLYVGTATQTIVVIKGAPAELELPKVYSPGKGALCIENETSNSMKWGMKLTKVEGENETVIIDWNECYLGVNDIMTLGAFDGGNYKLYFCYEEAMVENPNTGRYTVPEGAVTAKTCTIETPVYLQDNDGNEATYTLDYANSNGGELYVSPSAERAYEVYMKLYYREVVDAEEFNSFKAKYFTYDRINWYKLPEDKEIVIVNTSDEVEPDVLGATNVPVYNFEATLKDVLIEYVNLGFGDLNFTIDGDVSTGMVSHGGNLTIVGKGTNDSYTAGEIELRYGFDPSMTSNVTIQNLNTVTLGNENVAYAVYAINDITIKDCGVVSAEQGEEPYSSYYIYSALYSSNGDITIDNVDELSVNSAYVGIYASNGMEYESLSLNEEVTKGNIAISNVGKMNITSKIIGVYAKDNITFEDVFGSITALDTEDGCAVLTYGGAISVTNEKRFAVESGATKDNADRLTVVNNVVDMNAIGNYFAIVDDVFVLSKFVAKVDAALKDYEIFPVNNITVKADMDEFIQKVLDELEEEGLSFEVRSFNLTSAKDSEPGNIVVEIYFKYVDPENPQAIQEETLNTTIVIPLRVYVEEKYKELGAAMADIPEIITSANKQSYSDALAIVNELLKDANKVCLKEDELANVEWAYRVLVENLEGIAEIENALKKLNEDYNSIPADGELTSENIDAINAALELAKSILGEVAPHLTDAQKTDVETIKAELEEKLAFFDKIEADFVDLMVAEEELPGLDEITREDKEAVETLLIEINKFESAYTGNLTDEQKAIVAELKETVEARMDKIDADIVAIIEKVVKDTLASITEVTNDSDVKAKVEAAVAAAIAADPTLKGVAVTYDITKVNATTDAEGSIKGKVVITSGDVTKEVAVSIVIEKLPVPVHQHDFIWVIVKDATDTEIGKMEGTCACGETQTKEIPVTAGANASGNVTVESDEDNDFKAQLTDNEDVKGKIELTQDEQDAIIAGEDLEIILKLEDTTVEVDTAEKEDIAEKLAEKEFEGKKLGTFLDINLIKKIGNTETKITNTTGMLKLTFEVPASLINKDATINRTYTIVRNHEGKIEFLKAEFNKETNQLTFETDKFSTYAVIYEDTAVVPEAPKTADATNFMPILALLFAGLGMVVVEKKKRA